MFRTFWLPLLAILGMSTVHAQQTPKPATPETESKFVSGTEEVSLDLIVRDKHGKPVRDLKPGDIQIIDDGHPAQVRSLQLGGSLSASTRPDSTAASSAKPPAPPKADPMKQVHLVSMLFETLDLKAAKIARDGAYELLKGITNVNTYMTVLRVGGRVGVVQGFTNQREPLRKAIDVMTNPGRLDPNSEIASMEDQLKHLAGNQMQFDQLSRGDTSSFDGVGPNPGDPMAAGMAMLLLDVMETSKRVSRDQHARPAVASLLAVVRTMAKLPGRKVVVYFSEGLTLSEGVADQFARLTEEANRAGVTVYTVDASGLDPDAVTHDDTPFIPGPGGGLGQRREPTSMTGIKRQIGTNDRVADAIRSNSHLALRELAEATGGAFMGSTNDLKKPMHQLVEDEETYYLATYSPQIDLYDGHFRRITVKVNRPGVTVQTRSGYLALPPSSVPLQTFELPLLKAINDKSSERDVDQRSQAFQFSSAADVVTGQLVVEVPLAHLQAKENSAEHFFRLHFSVLALIKDASGSIAGQFSEDVPYQAATEAKASVMTSTHPLVRTFAVRPGKYKIETAVYDRNSEKVTVNKSDFEFTAATLPGVSDPVLVGKLDTPPANTDSNDALLYQGKKVVPRLTHEIRNDAGVVLPVFFVMYPDKQAAEKPSLALQVLSAGKLLVNATLPLPDNAAQYSTPFIASIPTTRLSPGDYTLRVVYGQGAVTSQKEITFVVQGEPRSALPVKSSNQQNEPETVATETKPLLFQQATGLHPLSLDDQSRILAGARDRALGYAAALPNFTVHETTRREVSRKASANWAPRDAFTELVRFIDGAEERKLIELNGHKDNSDRSKLDGMMLNGEFGFLLMAVFNQDAQAKFTWKESAVAGDDQYEVFSFQVSRPHSMYRLRTLEGHTAMNTAFDGEVHIDARTYHIRRVSLRAVEIPKNFPIRSTSLSVDYDRIMIGQSDHLVPTGGVIEIQIGRAFERNEVRFKNYRRLGSETTIKFGVE